jgi:hypothetical protein
LRINRRSIGQWAPHKKKPVQGTGKKLGSGYDRPNNPCLKR